MKWIDLAGKAAAKLKKLTHAQILVGGFAALILFGTVLLMLPVSSASGEGAGFLTALFTSTSASCVTGLIVVDTGTYWSAFGQCVILFLIQIGGLGFMAMATLLFLLAGKKISVKSRMLIKTSFNVDTLEGIIRYVKYVVAFTFLVELTGAILLSGVFIPAYGVKRGIFMSVFHAISAFCNAGFDVVGGGAGLTPFVGNLLLNLVICLLIIIGGLGFAVVMDIISKRRFTQYELNTKVVLLSTGVLILFGMIVVFIAEFNNPATMGKMDLGGKALASFFASVTPRTAGYNTIDMAAITDPTKIVTTMLMFIGGSPGSTAGGIKTTAFTLFILVMLRTLKGHDDVNLFQRRIRDSVVKRALAMTMMAVLWTVLATLLLTFSEPASIGDLLFEVVSALGTVGLTVGVTPNLSCFGRIVIILTMFMGRVGLITIAYAIMHHREIVSSAGSYKYPDGSLLL